jgi:large subunit ribosomal protein L24
MAFTKSSKPRKQRKALYSAPLHRRRKLVSAHLSGELRAQLGKRSLPIRKGDEIRIMRGSNAGKTGRVAEVDLKKTKIFVEGIVRKTAKGNEAKIPMEPSNLMITKAEFGDKMRQKILERSRQKSAKEEMKK